MTKSTKWLFVSLLAWYCPISALVFDFDLANSIGYFVVYHLLYAELWYFTGLIRTYAFDISGQVVFITFYFSPLVIGIVLNVPQLTRIHCQLKGKT